MAGRGGADGEGEGPGAELRMLPVGKIRVEPRTKRIVGGQRARPDRAGGVLRIRAEAATTGQTGVEMEAMTAASIAALTIYDMVKGVERGVEIRASGSSRRPVARAAHGSGRRRTNAARPTPSRGRAHVSRVGWVEAQGTRVTGR